MSTTITGAGVRRRLAVPLLAVAAALLPAVPTEAWHRIPDAPAARRPAVSVTVLPQKHPGAPVRDRGDALRAGGRRAKGPRHATVVRHGIDVSHWQGRIDWAKVARSGIDFVIAKATEGTWMLDPTYARNRAEAHRYGIRFSAYHYANPSRKRGDAKREADFFVKHAHLRGRDLVPALDLEEDGGLGSGELRRWTLQFLHRVEQRTGVRPMLYTSPGFWSGEVGDSTSLVRHGFDLLWLSHWGVRRPDVPADRWGRNGWTMWQWTARGRVPGITGFVDRDVYSGPRLSHLTIRAQRRDGAHHAHHAHRSHHHGHGPRPHPRAG
ncbi:MAG: glycoside hydrolase family 25 protein [Chloroflexota bacterium]